MSTHAKTTIRDEQDKPILSFYRRCDGYYSGIGKELAEFLKDFRVTNGYGLGDNTKTANGMSCLAAQLVAHFKTGIGGVYICGHNDNEEYNYLVRYITPTNGERAGKVSLIGITTSETRVFPLYDEIIPTVIKTVSFVYDKGRSSGEEPKWRTIEVIQETEDYIDGLQNGEFRRFSKCKIVGGKIITE